MTNRIKEILKHQGRSQAWIGRQIGKKRSSICDWCNNHHQPTFFDAYRVAKLLSVKMEDLIVKE